MTWKTVLISEVEGSAQLFGMYQDAAIDRWTRCVEAVHQHLATVHAEHDAKFTGDGFLIAFDEAATALRMSLAIRRAVRSLNRGVRHDAAIRLRTGLAAGAVQSMANDWLGQPVDRAHDLQSLAHGEEILVDPGVRDALGISTEYLLRFARELIDRGGRHVRAFRLDEADETVCAP